MILYLASSEHMNLLDFLQEEETVVPVKKMTGRFVLRQFIVYDIRNFSHCTHLFLDRDAFGDQDADFVQAIEEFLTMYSSRVTVIAEGLRKEEELFLQLLHAGVRNIVTATEIMELQDEIRQSLSNQGMLKYVTGSYRDDGQESIEHPKEHYRFVCRNVKVAVIASQNRIGATTAAMGIAGWIGSAGGEVCYVENNEFPCLAKLAASYEMEPQENGYYLEGIRYDSIAGYSNTYENTEIGQEYQFIVMDLGVCEEEIEVDVRLLICGIKSHELEHTARLLRQYEGVPAFILLPFVEEKMREACVKTIQSEHHKVLFLEYQPDYLDGWPNADTFRRIISRYIIEEEN